MPYKIRISKEGCRWVEPPDRWQFTLPEMIDGLCSEFFRHRTEGDAPLPESLTAKQIVDIVVAEHQRYGTNAVWTWAEQNYNVDDTEARAWARGLVLRVLPGLATDNINEEGTNER